MDRRKTRPGAPAPGGPAVPQPPASPGPPVRAGTPARAGRTPMRGPRASTRARSPKHARRILAQMVSFDPSAASAGGGLFGLPFSPQEARVVIVPVPWEATVSYGSGTADGPAAVLAA